MSTNPNQGQQPDSSRPGGYGGYSGYNPSNPADDPYATGQAQPGSAGAPLPQSDPNYQYGQGQQQQQQQQYGGGQYQPPSSVYRNSGGQGPSVLSTSTKRAALISYLGLCFTGIALFFGARKNAFVRFHAAQSIVVFTPLVVVYIVLQLIGKIFLLGVLLSPILGCLTSLVLLVGFVLWVFLMVQAYRGARFKLPVVGDYAEALIARFSKRSPTP